MSTFISWSADPIQYAVGAADVRFCNEPIPVARDMSGSELWKDLIGENVSLNFLDNYHQVLRIGSTDKAVYCWTSAFEEEGQDTLFISKQRP